MEIKNIFTEILINSLYLGNFLLFALLSLYIFRYFLKLENKKEDRLLSGILILSLAIAVSSLYSGESYGLLNDLIYIWVYSILSVILLIMGHFITDLIIFNKVQNVEEIKKGNLSILIVETAHFLSIGIVLNSLINNYFSPNINQINLFISIVLIFFFIQLLLLLSILIYEKFLNYVKNINLIKLVYQNNLSAGIFLFSNYIVISFLLSSVFSPDKDVLSTVVYSFIYFIFSIFIIIIFKILVDIILVPEDNIETIIENDKYNTAIFIELITISMIFIYHFILS